MRRRQIESKFIDLAERTLAPDEHAAIVTAIKSNPELTKLYQSYRDLIRLEQKLSEEKFELSPGFVVKVMERLEETERPFFERFFMKYIPRARYVVGGSVAVFALWLGVEALSARFERNYLEVQSIKMSDLSSDALVFPDDKESALDFPVGNEWSRQGAPVPDFLMGQEQQLPGSLPPTSLNFSAYTENPRISVATEPISTFSIDVDTASYTNMRRFVQSGQLPHRDSVRTEEYVNYFTYAYPKQSIEPFKVYPELAPSPFNPKRHLLKLGVKTKDIAESTKPWNLVFLVDVSGSMEMEDKLGLLKQALKLLASNMRENDKVSIVTYAGSAGTVLDGATKAKRDEIVQRLEALSAGGSTNGSGGITEAYAVAQRNFIKGGENRVILATDGDFNVGVTSHEELIKLIEDKRSQGVTLTTLGFGHDNLQDGTLEQLADKGNGNYFFIDSFNEARKVFGTELTTTIETVGKDVKIQIEFNPEHVASYRLIGYDNRMLKKEDFKNDQIDAGETGAGETVTALYEIALTGSEFAKELEVATRYAGNKPPLVTPDSTSSELAFVKIRYKEPEGSVSKELVFPIERDIARESAASASEDFRFAASVATFASILRGSSFVDRVPMGEIARVAKESLGADVEGYRKEFIQLVESVNAIQRSSSPATTSRER